MRIVSQPRRAGKTEALRVAKQRLEAAAPDLLVALKLAKSRLFGAGPATDPLYRTIRDAIENAEI